MTTNLNIKPDIKISVNQTFGFESEMEIEGFSKKKAQQDAADKLLKLLDI